MFAYGATPLDSLYYSTPPHSDLGANWQRIYGGSYPAAAAASAVSQL